MASKRTFGRGVIAGARNKSHLHVYICTQYGVTGPLICFILLSLVKREKNAPPLLARLPSIQELWPTMWLAPHRCLSDDAADAVTVKAVQMYTIQEGKGSQAVIGFQDTLPAENRAHPVLRYIHTHTRTHIAAPKCQDETKPPARRRVARDLQSYGPWQQTWVASQPVFLGLLSCRWEESITPRFLATPPCM